MTPEFAYFLKVNVVFVLFYAFYRLFFYKDTFFKLRRIALLAFFGLALLYPLFNIQDWVRQQEPIAEVIYMYSAILPEATARANNVAPMDWYGWILNSLGWIYWGGVILLFCRFMMQLGSILWLAHSCERKVIRGIPVYALGKAAGPFSFFRLIFLHPCSHSDKETEEILAHERTHVSQWHSIDVIVGELICMVCWFNPFVWLLKREVRHNLEYLADNTVIQSGYDCKSYQYHLLGLAHHQSTTALYNSFNVLHLRNRILMMNKKRSRDIVKAKYLIFIPLSGVLMLMSNIEAVARMAGQEMAPQAMTEETNGESSSVASTPQDEQVFTTVEVMPMFPGGAEQLLKFISTNIRYPKSSIEKGEQGRVICSFIVARDGSIHSPEIVRSVSPLLDKEAIRVLRTMPRWTPGMEKGKAVAVKYTVPVTFRLQKHDETPEATLSVVSEMPEYPGGSSELLKFLAQNIHYPQEAQEKGVQGRVICSFVIDKEGNVVDPKIVRGISPLLDSEALRVVGMLPRWTPGRNEGKVVRVLYTVPITFRLS